MPLSSHTSLGLFASAIALAVTASAGLCSAANSTVAVGNSSGNTTAYVTPTRQLETTIAASTNIVHVFTGISPGNCFALYTPPAGKAIVVTEVTYDLGSGTQGTESWGELLSGGCGTYYDIADTVQANETQSHTFPAGLPMPNINVNAYTGGGSTPIFIGVTGYLIPATQLPAESPENMRPRSRPLDAK